MSEIYSLKERIIIFLVISLASLIISGFYLYFHIDCNKASKIIFIMTLIYVSLFVFLNIIAMFDLFFGNVKGFEKFANFLSKFYYIFSLVDKILGFVIFTGLIYYLESGHHNKIARVMDYFVRSFYGIIGMSLCEKLILIFVGIPLFGGLLAILIIFRDHF
jgi:hypothetical protein